MFFNKYKFKIGDKVRYRPDGYLYRTFLQGVVGTITERYHYYDDVFYFVQFEDEIWEDFAEVDLRPYCEPNDVLKDLCEESPPKQPFKLFKSILKWIFKS